MLLFIVGINTEIKKKKFYYVANLSIWLMALTKLATNGPTVLIKREHSKSTTINQV